MRKPIDRKQVLQKSLKFTGISRKLSSVKIMKTPFPKGGQFTAFVDDSDILLEGNCIVRPSLYMIFMLIDDKSTRERKNAPENILCGVPH